MTDRRPLGEAVGLALNANPGVATKHSVESLERKLKRAAASEADQRRKRAIAEGIADASRKEIDRLKMELKQAQEDKPAVSIKPDQLKLQTQYTELLRRYNDSRTEYKTQLADMQERINQLEVGRAGEIDRLTTELADTAKQTAAELIEAEERNVALEEERDTLLDQISQASIAYGTLSRSAVDRGRVQELAEQLSTERLARSQAEARLAIATGQIGVLEEQVAEQGVLVRLYEAEMDIMREQLGEMGQCVAERDDVPVQITVDDFDNQATVDDIACLLDLALNHIDMLRANTTSQIAQLLATNADLSSNSDAALQSHAELATLRTTVTDLQSRHAALEAAHSAASLSLDEMRGKWKKSEAEGVRFKVLVHEAERNVADLEERNRADKEVLKRALDTASRARMAEEALDQDVADLRAALAQSTPFEALYNALKEEHEILLSRQAMTLTELEKLGEMNAELVRGSEDGKIGYIEGVRRDMAVVKHASSLQGSHQAQGGSG